MLKNWAHFIDRNEVWNNIVWYDVFVIHDERAKKKSAGIRQAWISFDYYLNILIDRKLTMKSCLFTQQADTINTFQISK